MPETNNEAYQPMTFDAIKIGLASTEKILEWSRGEVLKPETINYRTLKPEKDGLFCEKIFGPNKDWECHCGKYKKIRYKGVICDRCGVEVTKASVRRERMGHIKLAAPVSHIWYFKGIPSRMGLILDISPRILEKVLYFASYIVIDKGETDLEYKQVLSEKEYQDARETWGTNFRVGMGAEAVKELLQAIDLENESVELKAGLKTSTGQKRARIIKRLEVIEAFRESKNKPEWMVLDAVPVIPPDLRPMVQLDGGRFATSDLNDLYRRIINRNNRLRRLLELGAPDMIVRNEKRMLQEAVDALIDNGRRGRPVTGPGNRALKSLSDMLKGKSGRFRQNLLGKRVDYSGRSVIVVGPELKIYQCGLPKEMAIELFKPFVMKELVGRGISQNIKNAKKLVERLDARVWDVLEDVIAEHPVMLNRAPTLHRLGIQAFEPILVEGKAIKLHPLVCTAYNADFDGDQMAVHLPLSVEAQAECRFLLLSPNNLLKPSDGGPVAVPSQDMVLGIYYLTQERAGAIGEGKCFKSTNEAILAYENKVITLHSKIRVRISKTNSEGEVITGTIDTTLGRLLFNEILPQDLGFVDRKDPDNFLKLEVDFHVSKKGLKQILEKVINTHGSTKTAEVLDDVKAMGYKFSTRAAMTVSISDMTVPESKNEMLENAQAIVDQITVNFRRGLITEEERYRAVVETWNDTDKELTKVLLDGLDQYNNIFMMADSGARGSNQQIKQLAGMRGLMADTSGRTIELPIKSNFREGLDVLEYFMSAHGARKGLSDTALRTADSGYLTRRLVDVSQDLIIREMDCKGNGEIPGMIVKAFMDGKEVIESLEERITGRFSCETIKDKDGNVLVKQNHMITPRRAEAIVNEGVDEKGNILTSVKIRTILTCKSRIGICAKCYGANMATGEAVQVGEAVGIIAAQSIGEPGTQLTMRTFHTGGVAGDDITQGLPRVEELFEARKPKGLAIIAEFGGKAVIKDTKKKREIIITNDEGESKAYLIPYGSRIKIIDEAILEAGDELTEGSINPHDLLKIKGVRAVQDYMIREVQRVYRLQGVEINDKHIEVIVRQMLKKVRLEDNGDSELLPGRLVDILELEDVNNKLLAEGKEPAVGVQAMLGITKASLATDSFLSAASFQETTKVLTDAAIKGKIDNLIGLKENVIIGKLIPAGTGMKRYNDVHLDCDPTGDILIPSDEMVLGEDVIETIDDIVEPLVLEETSAEDLVEI
jgi:DNA-directed RNA polymerase subunit beta'